MSSFGFTLFLFFKISFLIESKIKNCYNNYSAYMISPDIVLPPTGGTMIKNGNTRYLKIAIATLALATLGFTGAHA